MPWGWWMCGCSIISLSVPTAACRSPNADFSKKEVRWIRYGGALTYLSRDEQRASPDIFVSAGRDDQATVRQFAEAPEAQGFSVWWDAALRSGETWDQQIETKPACALTRASDSRAGFAARRRFRRLWKLG